MQCDKIDHPPAESLIETGSEEDLAESSDLPIAASSDEHLESIINSTIDKVRMSSSGNGKNDEEMLEKCAVNGTGTIPRVLTPTATVAGGSAAQIKQATSSRWRHDDIPKEKIIGIYEAEKAKLESQVENLLREGQYAYEQIAGVGRSSSEEHTETTSAVASHEEGALGQRNSKLRKTITSFHSVVYPHACIAGLDHF